MANDSPTFTNAGSQSILAAPSANGRQNDYLPMREPAGQPNENGNHRQSRATLPPAPATGHESRGRHTLVRTRIGFHFFLAAVGVLICALIATAYANDRSIQTLMWLTAVAVCALIGMITMRTANTLQTIESELHRTQGRPNAWTSARPIIGSDPITQSWNELLLSIEASQTSPSITRSPATLNQEVVTLARAMRGLPVAWVITDRSGVIRFTSPAACGLLGLADESDHAGQDLLEILNLRSSSDEEDREKYHRLLSDLSMVRERHCLSMDSRSLQLRIRRAILDGRSGDGQGLAWILTDATQQDMATRARDQFLMTATHELRTPLGNLQAYAEALQEEDDLEVEQQKEFCNVIVSEANRLGRLVDQLLTVGQMEAGSMVAVRNELEMLPMVQYAWDQMTATAEKKSQKLMPDFAAKLPTVLGDRDKLQAALVNLVGNAVKYTPDGGEIIVRCGCDDEWIRVAVQDNGPGIAAEEHSKVFEKFYRGSNTIDLDERGNGLGLAFTREVARMHGGDIDLESTEGEGSTFTMRLPIGGQSRSGI